MILSETAKNAVKKELFRQKVLFPDLKFFIRMSVKDNGMYQTYFDYEEKANDVAFDFDNFTVRIEDSMVDYFKNIIVNYEQVDEEKFGFVVSGLGINNDKCVCDGECNEQC